MADRLNNITCDVKAEQSMPLMGWSPSSSALSSEVSPPDLSFTAEQLDDFALNAAKIDQQVFEGSHHRCSESIKALMPNCSCAGCSWPQEALDSLSREDSTEHLKSLNNALAQYLLAVWVNGQPLCTSLP